MTPSPEEIRRVLKAQSGDRRALDELFRSCQEQMFRYLVGIVGDPELAADVLQDVFVLIYRKLGALRQPELFRPWAYRIATRRAFRLLKKERRWSEQTLDESLLDSVPSNPAPEKVEPELLADLSRKIATVSPASRAVLVLHYHEELSLQEVSDVLGISLGTVKSRLAYGLARLRQAMATMDGRED